MDELDKHDRIEDYNLNSPTYSIVQKDKEKHTYDNVAAYEPSVHDPIPGVSFTPVSHNDVKAVSDPEPATYSIPQKAGSHKEAATAF